jgi:RHS repeat-associated protein
VAVVTYETQEDFDRREDRLTRLIATTIDGVAGVDLEINELISLGVPTPQRTDVIHLDEQNQTPYYVHLPYTIKPTEYWAQTVEIDLFEERVEGGQEPEDDKVRRYTWTGSSRFGEGHVLIPRTTAFDASKLITAQLVLNRGAPFEVRSDYFPVPILAKLISDASKQLYVAHHLDLVNEHSCVQSTPFTFTLGDDARVSLVFADADNPGQVYKILDNQQFDKGTHTLPFYLPAVQALLPDNTASYALEPGTYAFALTAVNIVKDEKNRDVAVGGALFEYLPNTLPVGRTLVRDVDVSNGNLILSTTDLHVPGRGVPLEFNRTYSANTSNVPGELGVGWRHNYRSRVIQDACDGVIVTGGAGDGSRFVKKDGQWQPLNGYHGTLKVDEINDTYDFYSPDGTQYHYENVHDLGAYHLIYISDPNGNTTKLGYDPDDKTRARLLTVEDASGRPLTFTYEEKTFNIPGTAKTTRVITRIEGPGAMSVDFEYDADGNLIQVAREEGARMDTYTYTPDRVVEIPDANAVARLHSKLETYTNPNGQITTYIYGDQVYRTTAVDTTIHLPPAQNGQTSQLKKTLTVPYPYTHVAQIDAPGMGLTQFAYNALARTTTVTNDRGADTTYTMDATGAVIQVDDPVGATRTVWESEHRRPKQRINARGVQTDYTYDSNGNLLSERIDGFATTYTYHSLREGLIKNRIASQTDRNGHTTQFTYDSAGNLRTVTDAAGGVIQHTYASNGDRLSTRDPNGHTTRYDYDPYGNVNTVTAPLGHVTTTQWDVRSRATAITRPGNQLYHYRYDSLNRMISQTNPMGGARTWTYDAMGNKLSDTDEAGRQTRFNYDAANRLTRVTNALDDSRIITYDTQGNKTSERDFRGHLTTFEYDLADRLTRRIEPLNRITLWQYDPVGNPVSETDALGRITRFEYDSLGQRLQTTDVLGDITTTVYDGEGNLIEQTDANGHTTLFLYDGLNQLIERRQPLGRHTTYAYDASGNRTEEIDAHGHRAQWTYDALNRLMRRTNALDHTTGYEYDPAGNLTREIDARLNTVEHEYDALNRRTSTTDAEGYRTAYAYDAVGNRIRETRANGNVMEWEYDDLNRPTRQRDNLGTVTRFAYDAEGNRIAVTDANGHTTTQVYDALNQLTEKQLPANRTLRFRYDPVGNKIAETDANGYITELAYDALNRVVTLTDPLDATSHRDYDAVGNLIRQTDPRGSTTDFDYDALNQLVATTDALGQTLRVTYDQVGNRVSETDKRGIITTFTYDLANQLLSTVRAGVTLRTLEYDAVGNVLSETDANGHTTVFVYDRRNLVTRESRPLAAITEHTYDSGGDRIETVDPEGRTTSWTYDERRRQLSATNGDGETTTFEYDGTGHRTRLERPEGNAWRFTYDAANRLTEVLDPEQGATTYTYDGNDNRLTQSDAKQQTTTFSYDDLNRLTQIQAADGTTTTYIYDAAGNRTEEIDANGQLTTHAYDALNRLTRTTYANVLTPTGDDLQQIDYGYDPNDNLFDVTEIYSGTSGVRVTTRSYDDFNRMLTVTDPEGHILTYNYDAVGNRLTLTAPARVTRYVYDALNRVESVITPQGVTEYLYDRSGRLTHTKYPTGAATVTAYDAAGRIETIQHTQQATPVSSYVYAYDANGNRLEERERRGGTEMLTTYRYDVVDRLEETTAGGRLTIYTYDAVSNRLSEHRTSLSDGSVAVDRSYAYNPRNQLTELRDELDPTLSVTFGYDANGNRTSQSTSTSTTTYVYDSRNQLRRLTQGGSSLGEFLYDWQGLRVRKQTLSETRHYVYDDQSVLLTTDDTGTIDSHYIYGPGHLLALDHVTQGPQYYLFDALGSVVGLIKPDGSLQSRYAYDAWGNVEDEAGDSANRFGFTGHELDSESGLYYAKARYYDPFVGLFLSEDPLLGNPLTPLSLHRYLYAYQNPLVYIDPDGEESISTLIDQAAEDCGFWICLGLAFTKGTYYAATLGFVGMHDPISDERDEGRVSSRQYWTHGVGGGLAVAGFNALSGRVGGAITQAATTLSKRLAVGAAVGAISSLGDDALNQSINISAGLQDEFSVSQNLKAASLGAVVETGSTVLGHSAANRSRQASRADRSSVSPERSRNVNQVQESSSTSSAAAVAENPAAPGTGAVDTLKTVDDYLRAVEDLDVSTAKNEAVFYSGRGNRELAEEFAIQNKRKTIEMTDGGKWLEQQNLYSRNSPLTPTEADEVWISLSRKYAEGASGNTFGFAEGARPQSIFNTVEYPTLLKNPNVTNTITGGY